MNNIYSLEYLGLTLTMDVWVMGYTCRNDFAYK